MRIEIDQELAYDQVDADPSDALELELEPLPLAPRWAMISANGQR